MQIDGHMGNHMTLMHYGHCDLSLMCSYFVGRKSTHQYTCINMIYALKDKIKF